MSRGDGNRSPLNVAFCDISMPACCADYRYRQSVHSGMLNRKTQVVATQDTQQSVSGDEGDWMRYKPKSKDRRSFSKLRPRYGSGVRYQIEDPIIPGTPEAASRDPLVAKQLEYVRQRRIRDIRPIWDIDDRSDVTKLGRSSSETRLNCSDGHRPQITNTRSRRPVLCTEYKVVKSLPRKSAKTNSGVAGRHTRLSERAESMPALSRVCVRSKTGTDVCQKTCNLEINLASGDFVRRDGKPTTSRRTPRHPHIQAAEVRRLYNEDAESFALRRYCLQTYGAEEPILPETDATQAKSRRLKSRWHRRKVHPAQEVRRTSERRKVSKLKLWFVQPLLCCFGVRVSDEDDDFEFCRI